MIKIKEGWHLPNHKEAKKRTKNPVEFVDQFMISEEQKHLGQNKTYYISTYGCQANERDSETLRGMLEAMGFSDNQKPEGADIILLNTCGIRENASNTVLGEIGSYKKLYTSNKDLVLGVCGCMSQEEGFVNTLLEKYPYVRLIFGTHNLQDLPEYVERTMNHEKVVEVFSKEGEVYENLPVHRAQSHKAWVNIMYGCDKFCTYCIVPYTRGKQRSRHFERILEEVSDLKAEGYKEVTLLGQNVNAYGKDLQEGKDFADLLEETAKTGIERVRFMTSHPWDFSDRMIEVIAKYDNIMPYIHLPLQSGDDEILKRMGRRYTSKEYLELFSKIKKQIPNASISTDIIVGFPNESDAAFEHTLDMVRTCEYDSAFTFIYSPRPQTPAAKMEDPIDMETKKQRLYKLNRIWNDLALKKNKKLEGTIQKVLVDGPSKKNPEIFSGYTEGMKLVNFKPGPDTKIGDIVDVRIIQAQTFSLIGEEA